MSHNSNAVRRRVGDVVVVVVVVQLPVLDMSHMVGADGCDCCNRNDC